MEWVVQSKVYSKIFLPASVSGPKAGPADSRGSAVSTRARFSLTRTSTQWKHYFAEWGGQVNTSLDSDYPNVYYIICVSVSPKTIWPWKRPSRSQFTGKRRHVVSKRERHREHGHHMLRTPSFRNVCWLRIKCSIPNGWSPRAGFGSLSTGKC